MGGHEASSPFANEASKALTFSFKPYLTLWFIYMLQFRLGCSTEYVPVCSSRVYTYMGSVSQALDWYRRKSSYGPKRISCRIPSNLGLIDYLGVIICAQSNVLRPLLSLENLPSSEKWRLGCFLPLHKSRLVFNKNNGIQKWLTSFIRLRTASELVSGVCVAAQQQFVCVV